MLMKSGSEGERAHARRFPELIHWRVKRSSRKKAMATRSSMSVGRMRLRRMMFKTGAAFLRFLRGWVCGAVEALAPVEEDDVVEEGDDVADGTPDEDEEAPILF